MSQGPWERKLTRERKLLERKQKKGRPGLKAVRQIKMILPDWGT